MASRSSIPKGATGVYRSDCPTSPPQFEDGETLTVLKKGPPGHCIVVGTTGIETVIRNSEIVIEQMAKKRLCGLSVSDPPIDFLDQRIST